MGIDLGKNSCSVVGLDDVRAVIKRRRMRRQSIIAFARPCQHAWSRWKPAAVRIISADC